MQIADNPIPSIRDLPSPSRHSSPQDQGKVRGSPGEEEKKNIIRPCMSKNCTAFFLLYSPIVASGVTTLENMR